MIPSEIQRQLIEHLWDVLEQQIKDLKGLLTGLKAAYPVFVSS